MRPHDVAVRLKIAASTVRQWSAEYRDFMSPHAAGGNGRHRSFTELDVRILYFIKEAKDRNQHYEEIAPVLAQLQENSWNDLPFIPEEPNMGSVPMVPEAAAHSVLEAERRSLLREIAFLRDQLQAREEAYQEQIQSRDSQITEQHERIAAMMRQIGELDVELRLYRSGRLKPE